MSAEPIITGLIVIAAGALLLGAAIAVAVNTSMGGTRSDYDDGSWLISIIGGVVVVLGVGFIVEGVLS